MNSNDFPLFIDPPEALSQVVATEQLRLCLRNAAKFGKPTKEQEVFVYATEDRFCIEIGTFRHWFEIEGNWSGCVSLNARLMLQCRGAISRKPQTQIKYDRGWLYLDTLGIGRALWQPKYDPDWMS